MRKIGLANGYRFGYISAEECMTWSGTSSQLSLQELYNSFTPAEAARMIYIPLLLTKISFIYIYDIIDYCVDNRLKFNKEVREIKALLAEYDYKTLKDIHQESRDKVDVYSNDFFINNSTPDTFYFSVVNELKKNFPSLNGYHLPTLLIECIALINYIEKVEQASDAMLRERTRRRFTIQNPEIKMIRKVLYLMLDKLELARSSAKRVALDKSITLAVRIAALQIEQLDIIPKD